jgi:peptidyl-prolyl cis-trans isomerase SurA
MKYMLSAALLLSVCSVATAQKTVLDKVVAKVGDNIILLSDVEERYRALDFKPEDARCLILDQMLTENILLAQAEIDSVVVADEDVETQLDARVDRILQMMGYDREQFIAYYGKTPEMVKEDFRSDLKQQLLTQRMQSTIIADVKVTPSDVREFYQKIPRDSLPYFNSEVEIGEIVLEPQPSAAELQRTEKELEGIRKRILAGESFGTLAKQYSMDPGSGRNGGDLGWGKRGSYVTEFEAAAYKLKQDEISPVIKTEYGYHIIQLLDRRGNLIHLRHILIKPRITEADKNLTLQKLDSIRTLITIDSLSFSRAVYKFSSDKAQSKTNAGLMVNPASGNSIFEVAELEPDVYFSIDTMEISDISAPMVYRNPNTGEELCRLILLRSRTDPHQANLLQDYSKIQAAALQQKKATYLSDWIEQKAKEFYIQIDPMYECEILDRWRNAKTLAEKP